MPRNCRASANERGRGVGKSERRSRSEDAGEPSRGTPPSKGRHRIMDPLERKMPKTPSFIPISTKLERIAKLAREAPGMAFKTLAHHIDVAWLHEAYRRTRKDGAPGVDRQTAEEYATNLEENLRSLLDRAKSGTYRAPPVRRVHIPKGSGAETRPIGIPTFEDKVLQRAVAMVLEAVYEQDFLECSYGFRPRRSAHHALDALWNDVTRTAGGWVLEIDVRKFFDTMDHGHIQEILRRRVLDGVLLRLIGKWLNAGVVAALIGASRALGVAFDKPLLPRKASLLHPLTLRNRLESHAFGSSPWSRTLRRSALHAGRCTEACVLAVRCVALRPSRSSTAPPYRSETLRQWMSAAGIWLPRSERRKRPHPPRYRRPCVGELVQIDGCDHEWFEARAPRCVLLVYVDDATSRVMELRFVPS